MSETEIEPEARAEHAEATFESADATGAVDFATDAEATFESADATNAVDFAMDAEATFESADASESTDAAEPPALPARTSFRQLEDVILDDSFPEVDLALRRGRHIHPGDERWYEFLLDAQGLLEPFYRRFGCALEQRNDGYFFLLPVGDGLGKRHLGVPEMIVGQGLALCFLDPRTVPAGGVITREELLNQLASVMGTDALMQALNPKRKRADERVMQRTVRQKVNEALRRLSQLGFVELLDGDQLRLWPSLMRFAEPVRGLDAPSEALKRLIERGEISLGPGDDPDDPSPTPDSDPDGESNADPLADPAAADPAATDAVSESEPVADSDSDSVSESDPVSDSDAASESDSVSVSDSESESESESEPVSDSESESDSVSESDSEVSESDPDTTFDAVPDSSLPPELDIDWDAPPGDDEPPGEKA